MSFRIVAFKPEHLADLRLQDAQREFQSRLGDADYGAALAQVGNAFTGMVDGRVVGCAGAYEIWPGRAVVWALLSDECGPHFKAIHRAVQGFFLATSWRRVEAVVRAGFPAGHRWIRLLGFRCETPDGMPGYSPDGETYYLYSRLQP